MATLLGFAPSVRVGPPNTQASTNVTISAGSINGVLIGLQKVAVGTTVGTFYVSVDSNGNIGVTSTPQANLICTVVIGMVVTSGTEATATGALSGGNSTNLTLSMGITSLVDNRNWS
jgi:hypothetical protein